MMSGLKPLQLWFLAFVCIPGGMATRIATGSASARAVPQAAGVHAPVAHAIRFSRGTDCIQLTGGALGGACPLGTPFTIEAIVRPTADGNIWQQWADGSMDQRFTIKNQVFQIVEFDTPFKAGYPLPLDQWSHIAWCYDGADIRLYQNGSLVLTAVPAAGFNATGDSGNCAIGFKNNELAEGSNLSFEGDLAGFRISNTDRYAGTSYTPPNLPLTSDRSTLLLIDPYSSSKTPTVFAAPGSQKITATFGTGGAATSPSWVAYTP